MSRLTLIGASLAGLTVLVGLCYGPAIAGGQFAFRDAAHYYYPLYQRVEAEWEAGRWPLWEPEENGGIPLLGNPTAAVLYPGKIIYRALAYPLAARVYTIAHTLLAFAGAVVLARSLGIGGTGSVIAGIGYAFGAPVLFQYCNIIYLVGAAWLPWGFAAIDAWLRRGRRWGIAALGAVLAMQVFGGDPQAAYLSGLCGGAYALVLARAERERQDASAWRRVGVGLGLVALLAAWAAATLVLAWYLPQVRPRRSLPPVPTYPWNPYVPLVVAGCWAVAGGWLFARWRGGHPGEATLGRRLVGLAAAAVLAGLLAAAQLLPVVEFTRRTGRAADEGTHDIYPFSLEPYRFVELLLPNVFGSHDRGNRFWLNFLPPVDNHKIWVNSLYLGAGTLALALAGLGGRGAPPWRRWMIGIAGVSLVASMGEFASPIWAARWFEPMTRLIGPHDPSPTNAIRMDGFLRDGDGSPYHLLSVAVPGFQQFRYPSKLLTLTVLALAVLAGHGWDRLEAGARRVLVGWSGALLTVAVGAAIAVGLSRARFLAALNSVDLSTIFGPLDAAGAFSDAFGATLHAAAALAVMLGVAVAFPHSRRTARAAAILLVALDIALANRRLIATTDQANFERVPKALAIIAEAERDNPSPGPYRVHRMPIWKPDVWRQAGGPDRYSDFVRWETDTLQPKYGLGHGVEYTFTHGVAELYDYEWFFAPWTVRVDPGVAKRLGMSDPSERIVYYPRRGFDLWNTRYFILPGIPLWTNPDRGLASFVVEVESIYPKPGTYDGPDGPRRREEQLRTEDFQVLRSRTTLPRAWVVHEARFLPPIEGLSRGQRAGPMEEMLYAGDLIWNDPDRHAFDPRRYAWIEVADSGPLARFCRGGPVSTSEAVEVRRVDPQRVELDVTLESPGIVVLADAFYPGWTLTVDERPAEILRTNRMMRGVALETGRHRLVYEYRPRSFAIGKVVSLCGLVALVAGLAWSARGPRRSPDALGAGDREDVAHCEP